MHITYCLDMYKCNACYIYMNIFQMFGQLCETKALMRGFVGAQQSHLCWWSLCTYCRYAFYINLQKVKSQKFYLKNIGSHIIESDHFLFLVIPWQLACLLAQADKSEPQHDFPHCIAFLAICKPIHSLHSLFSMNVMIIQEGNCSK